MTRLSDASQKYAAPLMLAAAFVFGGTKTPFTFCVWALAALGWSTMIVKNRAPDRRTMGYFLAFNAGVLLSQMYSIDPMNSLLWTAQSIVFSCLWLALQTASPFPDGEVFWQTLQALGAITALVTTYQWTKQMSLYGLLPINPNFNAVWMAALAAAFLAKARPRLFEKILCLGLAFLVVLGKSRSGLLALLVGVGFGVKQRHAGRWVVYSLGLLGIVALLVPHAWLLDRLNLFENGGRLRIWEVALKALAERPLTGYGAGNFELAYLKYAFPVEGAVRYARTTAFAHNDYLQALSEWGWPTAGLLILGFFGVLLQKRSGHPLAAPAKAILLALGSAAFFNPVFKMPMLVFLAILATSSLRKPAIPKPGTSPRLLIYMGLVGLLTLWCGVRSRWGVQQQWDRILKWDKNDAEAWHALARYTKTREDMLFCYRQAAALSPFEPYYVEALARALESFPGKSHLPEALQTYMTAIHLAPTRAVNDLAVARLLWRTGEAARALEWVEKARALEPNYWEADFWKARCLRALGRPEDAVFVLKDLRRRHREFQKTVPLPPSSPYEDAILRYNNDAVSDELSGA